MPTLTTRPPTDTLLLALDLGNTTWTLGFGRGGSAAPPRLRTIPARDLTQLRAELVTGKQRVGLPADAAVVSCYEAGRDGFWLHRALTALGVANLVVDSASIEVTRRARQAKSDRLDTTALLTKLARHVGGDRDVWSVVHVPSVEDEDRRQLHRELWIITRERTRVVNRIKALLALHGVVLAARGLPRDLPPASALLTWNGTPLPPAARARLEREWTRLTTLRREIRALIATRRALLAADDPGDPTLPMVRRLLALRAVGEVSAWIYTTEFFAWRQFRNRRQVGAAAGRCGTRRDGGDRGRSTGSARPVTAISARWRSRSPGAGSGASRRAR